MSALERFRANAGYSASSPTPRSGADSTPPQTPLRAGSTTSSNTDVAPPAHSNPPDGEADAVSQTSGRKRVWDEISDSENDAEEDSSEGLGPSTTTKSLGGLRMDVARKRARTLAMDLTTELNLEDNSLISFADFDLHQKLIMIYARLMKKEQVSRSEALSAKLASADFQKALGEKLTTVLLSPRLTSYRTDLSDRIVDMVRANTDVFEVPPEMFSYQSLHSKLSSQIKSLLTAQRGSIKSKIMNSIHNPTNRNSKKNTQNICELARTLSTQCMEMNERHWERIAWLRSVWVDFEKKDPAPKNSDPETFWAHVDQQLANLQEAAEGDSQGDPEQIKKYYRRFYTDTLQCDLQTYKREGALPPLIPTPRPMAEWQETIQRASHRRQ